MNTTNLLRFPRITATLLIAAGMLTTASYCLTPAADSTMPRTVNNIVDPDIPALVIVGKRARAIALPLKVDGQVTRTGPGGVATDSNRSSTPIVTAQSDMF
jgi:hypothetical protein